MFQVRIGRVVLQCRRRSVLAAVAGLVFIGLLSCAYAGPPKTKSDARLRAFLQKFLKRYPPVIDQDLRYSAASVSLDGGAKRQYLVYIASRWWCGSGGCAALLVEPQGVSSFRVIERFTLARLPIRILPSKTHGWHDLTMPVAGGGIIHRYTALLRFNGQRYPSNPSMAPKLPEKLMGLGTEVPLSERGSLVYPRFPNRMHK